MPLTYLQLHYVVLYDGRPHRVVMVNDCRARVVPLKKQVRTFTPHTGNHAGETVTLTRTETGDNISPNSRLEILGIFDPATDQVKWFKGRQPFDPGDRNGDHTIVATAVLSPGGKKVEPINPQPRVINQRNPLLQRLKQTDLL